jgi:hypothetical protein
MGEKGFHSVIIFMKVRKGNPNQIEKKITNAVFGQIFFNKDKQFSVLYIAIIQIGLAA